ncbi:uncharacterized protein LODBEIA_P34330 [Lodderomyces beijingensis]|uniref:PQ-loop-domain-containing protein n=1 Tax=Lodderomyces beijingensis TaxID=1775926 RepID=A0ABP0ZM50_9ASCO
MISPPAPIYLDAQAISGITGSISIACWIIVFAPQIYENFTRKSSEGLSLTFIVLWLAGDVFNVLGAVLQGLLPTMIILAVYYTLADIVLLWQCLVYRDGPNKSESKVGGPDLVHLNPTSPMNEDVLSSIYSGESNSVSRHRNRQQDLEQATSPLSGKKAGNNNKLSAMQTFLLNFLMVALVFLAGFIGWFVPYLKDAKKNPGHGHGHVPHNPEDLKFDPLAQTFGWLCAILYLGSRIPQIVLNYERKSVSGLNVAFFLFACLGNSTYVISILSIDTSAHYLWVNSSWLAGSLGTLVLDFLIFIQFFIYNDEDDEESDDGDSETDTLSTASTTNASGPLLNGHANHQQQQPSSSTSYGSTRT